MPPKAFSQHVKKFFTSMAWAGAMAVLGTALILGSPFFFIYLMVRQPMNPEDVTKKLDKLKDWLDPDGDQDWRKEHRRQYGD